VASRAALRAQLDVVIARFPPNVLVARPPHWGGYVLWAHTVELWVEGAARLHDRARWTRTVKGEGTPLRQLVRRDCSHDRAKLPTPPRGVTWLRSGQDFSSWAELLGGRLLAPNFGSSIRLGR
jgi:hypothetical protein